MPRKNPKSPPKLASNSICPYSLERFDDMNCFLLKKIRTIAISLSLKWKENNRNGVLSMRDFFFRSTYTELQLEQSDFVLMIL